MTHFPNFPDEARLWVFAADRPLSDEEQTRLLTQVRDFLDGWTSHARPVAGEAMMHENRFLLVSGYLGEGFNAGISGCGIDSMVAAAQVAADEVGISWEDGLEVTYRDDSGVVRTVSRGDFREAVRQGRVTGATMVIDTAISDLGSLRRHGLERTAAESWHGRVFRLESQTDPSPVTS